MVSEKEQLKREIRIVKEAIAITKRRREVGHNPLSEMQEDISIPKRFHHLLNQDLSYLKDHLERLEEDLNDLQELNQPERFSDAVGYHGGRRIGEEDDG